MRIITGKYKGRHFDVPRTFKARPTTDFAKENIFNVINAYQYWEETDALDLFAGTGSISLELLSRGCQQVISVEKDRDHARFISQCMEKLGADNNILIKGDVFRFLKSCHQQFDLIFQYDLLKEDGLLVFEHGKNNNFSAHPRFLEHRSYGSVNFTLFR